MRQYDTRKLDINFSLSGSHFEVIEGSTFTITLEVSGPDAKAGLQIPYRVIGTIKTSDYFPNEEYGLFTINEDLTSTMTYTILEDQYNEPDLYFIISLLYYPTIQRLTVIKNIDITYPPKTPEPIPNPPTFELVPESSNIFGGLDATINLIYHNMRPGVKIYYNTQSSFDRYPVKNYVYSEKNGVSTIKIVTSIRPIKEYIRVWLENHPKVETQIIVSPVI